MSAAEQVELAFVKTFAKNLSSQPVTYPDDYQQPLENCLKKVPVFPVPLPPPPERKEVSSTPSAASINITFKSTKPPQSYTLSVQPTDTIQTIKSQLAAAFPGAPPPDAQRLLLKGKALADGKLLKEYEVKDGDTINLMVKPGFQWDPTAVSAPAPPSTSAGAGPESITLLPEPANQKTRSGHSRIPSVVLSPSPSLGPVTDEKLVDIPLLLDTSNIPTSLSASGAPDTPYHMAIAQPEFWQRLYNFLQTEFPNQGDAAMAWEEFFRASKGQISVNQIAKIRDRVGVMGMAGT